MSGAHLTQYAAMSSQAHCCWLFVGGQVCPGAHVLCQDTDVPRTHALQAPLEGQAEEAHQEAVQPPKGEPPGLPIMHASAVVMSGPQQL